MKTLISGNKIKKKSKKMSKTKIEKKSKKCRHYLSFSNFRFFCLITGILILCLFDTHSRWHVLFTVSLHFNRDRRKKASFYSPFNAFLAITHALEVRDSENWKTSLGDRSSGYARYTNVFVIVFRNSTDEDFTHTHRDYDVPRRFFENGILKTIS